MKVEVRGNLSRGWWGWRSRSSCDHNEWARKGHQQENNKRTLSVQTAKTFSMSIPRISHYCRWSSMHTHIRIRLPKVLIVLCHNAMIRALNPADSLVRDAINRLIHVGIRTTTRVYGVFVSREPVLVDHFHAALLVWFAGKRWRRRTAYCRMERFRIYLHTESVAR